MYIPCLYACVTTPSTSRILSERVSALCSVHHSLGSLLSAKTGVSQLGSYCGFITVRMEVDKTCVLVCIYSMCHQYYGVCVIISTP